MQLLVLFALLAAFTHSLHSIANKFLVARGGLGALPATFLMLAVTGIIAVPLMLLTRTPWVAAGTWAMLLVVALAFTGFTFMMYAFSREDASAVGPILGLKVIFLAVLESVVRGQSVGMGIWAGAVLSVVGITLMSQTDHWSLRPATLLRPGMALMAAAAISFALCDTFVKITIDYWKGDSWGVSLYVQLIQGAVALLGLVLLPRIRAAMHRCGLDCVLDWATLPKARWPLLISATTIVVAQYLLFASFAAGGQVTMTNILYNTRGLFVVLLMALLVLGRGSTVERVGRRAYVFRTTGALLTMGAILFAIRWG